MRCLLPALLLTMTACSEFDLNSTVPRDPSPVDDGETEVDVPPAEENEEPPAEETEEPPEDPPVAGEPVADAGDDVTIDPLDWYTIDAKDSYDPGGNEPLSYRWSIVSKPSESGLFILNKTKQAPKLWFDVAGDYTFQLEVQNSVGVWDSTPDTVTITAEPSDRFYVQLSWDADSDLDLHLVPTTSTPIFDSLDCAYCNQNPSWLTSSALDDPSLDWDDIDGQGPETTTIEDPSAGTFKVMVHYYGQDGDSECYDWPCPVSNAKVDFYIDGVLVKSETGTLVDQGDVWEVATVTFPSATITPLGTMDYTSKTDCN